MAVKALDRWGERDIMNPYTHYIRSDAKMKIEAKDPVSTRIDIRMP